MVFVTLKSVCFNITLFTTARLSLCVDVVLPTAADSLIFCNSLIIWSGFLCIGAVTWWRIFCTGDDKQLLKIPTLGHLQVSI